MSTAAGLLRIDIGCRYRCDDVGERVPPVGKKLPFKVLVYHCPLTKTISKLFRSCGGRGVAVTDTPYGGQPMRHTLVSGHSSHRHTWYGEDRGEGTIGIVQDGGQGALNPGAASNECRRLADGQTGRLVG